MTSSIYIDIEDIKKANADIGRHWFDAETMAYFNSYVYQKVYFGRFFITSEQDEHGAWEGQRRYTVRECIDGEIHTTSEFGEFDTFKQAQSFARQVGAYHEALR